MRRIPHDSVYTDRLSERALCYDFPADKAFIDGLHAMQSYFVARGSNFEIPVVRVMNTAHLLAAYMFATSCSGDQMEYDCMADMNLSRDRKLFKMTIIVLAAMLARTEGFRARQCRNMLLANRDADFDEGVTLYNRFLRSAEEHFAEEDFLIDTHVQIQKLITENEQLAMENRQLRYTITTMEKQYNQFNQYNAPVYQGCTINNNFYGQEPQTEQAANETESVNESDFFCRITQHAIETGHAQEVEDVLRSASVSAPKLVKAIKTNEALGYLDTQNLTSTELYDMLNEHFGLAFKYRQFVAERSK